MRSGQRLVRASVLFSWLAFGVACSGGSEEATPSAGGGTETTGGGGGATAEGSGGGVAPTPAEAREAWEEDSFELRSSVSGPFTSGSEATFEVVLRPRGIYHVNEAYPMSIALSGPAEVAFPAATVPREAATEYGETVARFPVRFTPSAAGEHRVTATVDFAVCTPEACMPDTRTLAVLLPVQ